MRYVFGTNTRIKKSVSDGEVFKTAETDKALTKKRDVAAERFAKQLGRAGAPLPFGLYIAAIFAALAAALPALLVIVSISHMLGLSEGFGISEYYSTYPVLFWVGGIGLIFTLTVFVLHKRISSKAEDSGKLDEAAAELDRIQAETDSALGIPANTAAADVIEFSYAPDGESFTTSGAELLEVRVWSRSDGLRIAANDDDSHCSVYTVPKGDIKRISILPHGFDMGESPWNKEKSPQSECFRKRGVAVFRYGQIALKYCCALEIEHGGEEYKLLFPAYELDTFCAMTGLPAPELPSRKELAAGESGNKEPIRPIFYWKLPEGKGISQIVSPTADYEFKSKHPWAFRLFFAAELIACLAPLVIFLAAVAIPAKALDPFSGWALLGLFGGLITGSGLANIIGAWEHQYLGHWVTIALIAFGGAAMALGAFKLIG